MASFMRKRTKAREFALQVLYQLDITHDTWESALENFWSSQAQEEIADEVKHFAADLVKGTTEKLGEIDAMIARYATNWQIERMAVVDRNILRMGCFELMYREDIPPKVSINEGVDLAKLYSGAESGKFVNAILDKAKEELKR